MKNEPIAVVGMAGRFPGARDVDAFWRLLSGGVDAITEVPRGRWDVDALYDADSSAPGKMSTRWGGFLDDVDGFDAAFFGISPREARRMDPQQRLALELGWEALEDAGQTLDGVAGTGAGVFMGVTHFDHALATFARPAEIGAFDLAGTLFYSIAGRLSYFLDLRGPSVALDAACASSLAAVHAACRSLRDGECPLALAGGVNLILDPAFSIAFSKAGAMSPRGRSRSLDAGADGFVRGEGGGVVVLKTLSSALRDGDPIRAVVRGTAFRHGGRSFGYTVPNGAAQRDLMRAALADGGVDAGSVGCVEAHATGTPLGDPIEMEAIADVYGAPGAGGPCLVGSAKTNIGHLESAAGVAGLIKAILQLERGAVAPLLHLETLNPKAPWDGTRLVAPTKPAAWPRGGTPRRAAVSSFGISGAIAHAVLEEAPLARAPEAGEAEGERILPLSARAADAVEAAARALADRLSSDPGISLRDLCWTAAARRTHHDFRLAVAFGTRAELIERLANPAARAPARDPRLSALAERWASGGEAPWKELHAPGRCVSLPGYPWRRERFERAGAPSGGLYELVWEPRARPAAAAGGGDWLVVGEGAVAAALAAALAARGARASAAPSYRAGAWRGVVDVRASVTGALALVQDLARAGLSDAPRLWLVTRGAGSAPDQAAVRGLGRVIQAELPELRCALVDLEGGATEEALADELLADGTEDQLVLRGESRFAARVAPRAEPAPFRPALSADGTYVITGGLGALGLAVAARLAARGAKHLLLIGRGAPTAEAERALGALRTAGVEVEAARADAADEKELSAALARAKRPVRGVVHAAGVLDDAVLLKLDERRLGAVMAPKAAGARNLERLLAGEPLEFFVLFSSAAAVLGRAGQGNYAAANASLDAFAAARRARGLPAVSIGWGGWARFGMAAELARRTPGASSSPLLEPERALDLFECLLSPDAPAHVLVLPTAPSPSGPASRTTASAPAEHPAPAARRAALARRGEERRAYIEEYLLGLLAKALPGAGGALDARTPLADLGLDSLNAVDVAAQVERELGVKTSVSALTGKAGAAEVASALAKGLDA